MSGGQYFEDYTFRSYALFWPRDSGHKPQCVEQSDFLESWKEAVLDRESGAIYDPKPRRGHIGIDLHNPKYLNGWLFDRHPGKDKKEESPILRGLNATFDVSKVWHRLFWTS